ncbi:uncharacterized protein [Rhodnius prolixus]|uniref:uncharacterized protein n=1 Tax=Rhodnius prolixus TaxID=13249 RepID=UPI003D18DDFA
MYWMYTAVVRPILAYGCIVWLNATRQKTLCNGLQRVQRLACLLITGALQSTPTAALEFMLRLPPLDIFLRGEALMAARRLESVGTWASMNLLGRKGRLISHADLIREDKKHIAVLSMPGDFIPATLDFSRNYGVQILAREEACASAVELSTNAISLFTDGSLMDRAGAGLCIWGPQFGFQWERTCLDLGNYASVFQAELAAIEMAATLLRWKGFADTDVRFFTDSQAAIKALASPSRNQISVNSCHAALNLLGALNTVSVAWSPGHSGIPGNELADETAKEGAALITMTPQPITPVSYRRCRTEVEQWILKEHRKRWRSRTDCRQAKEILGLSRTDMVGFSRSRIRQLVQVLSGHANLAYHLFKCGLIQSPNCAGCGESDETVRHFVEVCPVYSKTRFLVFGRSNVSLPEIVASGNLNELSRFIQCTGRLSRQAP